MNGTLTSGPLRIVLAGAGKVGTATAELLRRRGHTISGIWSRSADSAERAAALTGAPVLGDGEDWPDCDLVLIGASDAAIGEVAARAGSHVGPDTVVCHFAGSLGPEVLAPASRRAVALHPVASCPTLEAALLRIPGSAWGVTCDDDLYGWVESLVLADLEGHPVRVAVEERERWHAAAVVTSNGIAALLASGEAILSAIGIDDPVTVLGPLAAGVVANARDGGGGGAALTGPVARGEADTITRHLDALRALGGDHASAYVRASRVILAAAAERLGPQKTSLIADVLESR